MDLAMVLGESRKTLDMILAKNNLKSNAERSGSQSEFDDSKVKIDRKLLESVEQATRVTDQILNLASSTLKSNQAYLFEFEERYES